MSYTSPRMRTIVEPPQSLVEGGKVRFGTFAGPIADVNLIDAQPWSLPIPRALRALRLKEWQAFQFGNQRYFVIVALFNAKLLALAQVKIYDREQRRKWLFEHKLPGWALQAPRNLLDSQMSWTQGPATIRFDNKLAQGRIDITLELPERPEMPAISGTVTAHAEGHEFEVVSIPFAENRGMYSNKGCLALSGELRIGDQLVTFERDDSFLLMDDHKGYYPRVMRWDWVTGGGFDDRGRRIAFNLTRNDSIDPVRYNENCLWIDGRVHLLPPVRFERQSERSPEIWAIRADSGEVEVDFVIEADGHVRVNALVIESRYRGPFGQVRGRIRGPLMARSRHGFWGTWCSTGCLGWAKISTCGAESMSKTTRKPLHLALMRGINVGGKNKLAMSDLAAAFEQLGCTDVVTRGNTGNVLFRAPARLLPRLADKATALLQEQHGVTSPVIVRAHAELIAICERNPFVAEGCEPSKLHVAFLASEPEPARVEALDPQRSPPDRFVVLGREIYLHCPDGLARTKLSNAWFDGKLKTISTVRTWKVVSQLRALMG